MTNTYIFMGRNVYIFNILSKDKFSCFLGSLMVYYLDSTDQTQVTVLKVP